MRFPGTHCKAWSRFEYNVISRSIVDIVYCIIIHMYSFSSPLSQKNGTLTWKMGWESLRSKIPRSFEAETSLATDFCNYNLTSRWSAMKNGVCKSIEQNGPLGKSLEQNPLHEVDFVLLIWTGFRREHCRGVILARFWWNIAGAKQ